MRARQGTRVHIADGIIATEIVMGANAACLGALYLAGRRTEPEEIPRMGFIGAALFAVSLMHFPMAGTSMHLALLGLGGIILGGRVFPVLLVVLLFQSLLFQHGGFLSVGLNTLNMGAGAVVAGWIWRRGVFPPTVRAFLAGFVGIVIPALLMGVAFMLTGYGRGMLYLLSLYSLTAGIEGLLTVAVVRFLQLVQPDILEPAKR